jgi:lipoyl(octanoyl) transferase
MTRVSSPPQPVLWRDLGSIPYQEAWDYQEQLLQQNVRAKAAGHNEQTIHHLLFCEHPAVITLGKSGDPGHLLLQENRLRELGIAFFRTNRGGDITFHGPGQIVGYPILDLEKIFTDIGRYLRSLEEVIIRTLAEYGITGERSAGETGVWIEPQHKLKARKICAMGVRCSRWITMHGFALNVNTDLNYFNYIIPCGIADKQVTSLEKELGYAVPVEEVREKLRQHFEAVFQVRLAPASHLSAATGT